ncbi:hypothetical protein KIH39_21225 [Telmatocola sphagniphila]|uniref:Uncharacterized protein n=1 Tax=Telmatocola sphagniphila TaxID=1123043 RepID=A0A8E6EX73_9BACT|nr:hypothetical protein [Telmatocola sphagniphila]QVL31343.1 hypothetical protein KIH39_21225 [Telmatocola sphagniphila]
MDELGVKYQDVISDSIVFETDESSANWSSISSLLALWKSGNSNVIDMVSTKFTEMELLKAENLVIVPGWHHGYPEPDIAMAYLKKTYDEIEYCSICGIGLKQREQFILQKEPKWGSKQILQLNWIFDEYFVTPEVWELVFKPFRISSIPVSKLKTGNPLATVVQLKVSDVCEPLTPFNRLNSVRCDKCGRSKYASHTKGPFPHVVMPKNSHIAKTAEYFGNGANAYKEIIVSRSLYHAIVLNRLKGADFKPVESSLR